MKVNSLSMIAEDYAESQKNASMIYDAIRKPLVSRQVSGDRKLPLVYVLDSILKIVKGKYVPIIEVDAKQWMPLVHQSLSDEKRGKLKKVWNLWKDAGVFSSEASWKEIGACFSTDTAVGVGGAGDGVGPISNSALEKAGISWGVREQAYIGIMKILDREFLLFVVLLFFEGFCCVLLFFDSLICFVACRKTVVYF